MKKIIIFGGEGYIGKVLSKSLIDKNYEILYYDNLIYEDQSLLLMELETKVFEYNQKLKLRDNLIESLKDQIKVLETNYQDLEKNNTELLSSIELNSIKKNELNNFQKKIEILKKDAQKQNNKLILFEEENIELNDKIKILNDKINKLVLQNNKLVLQNNNFVLQKNEMSTKIKNLQSYLAEKEEIIENLIDNIHH